MNCLQNLPRSSVFPLQCFNTRKSSCSVNIPMALKTPKSMSKLVAKAVSGSTSRKETDDAKMDDEKSEVYSNNMTEAMGAVLTYRHELGMNYNFIRPDLIVGSCLQTPEDVDKLRDIGVKTIFCLQQDSDLEYFGVDINAIREYANSCDDIEHVRAPIRINKPLEQMGPPDKGDLNISCPTSCGRSGTPVLEDFDMFDLRMRLPPVVSILHKAINRNGGVTYIHCTAGLGRAPATVLAYMFWVQGYKLSEAHKLLMSKRSCFPKLDAIKSATADILTGLKKKAITLSWYGGNCSTVEISGLDIGWGQRIPLNLEEEQGAWTLRRELPEGHYEYKYIVDGEWVCNKYDLMTHPNKDGHVNNYINVLDSSPNSINAAVRRRLTGDDPHLTRNERLIIRQYLEACPDDE